MKKKIVISRSSVMGLVEGISITIAQHSGGTPTIEQLWASAGDMPKLDIYYREAISDLEQTLRKYLVSSTLQFDLQATADDYALELNLSSTWSQKLSGLLSNTVQNYLVHTVTAGWLNDFPDLKVKQDYQQMAGDELEDILRIVSEKSFSFTETERNTSGVEKPTSDSLGDTHSRQDDEKKTSEHTGDYSQRIINKDKEEDRSATSVSGRHNEDAKDDNIGQDVSIRTDDETTSDGYSQEVVSREEDNETITDQTTSAVDRKKEDERISDVNVVVVERAEESEQMHPIHSADTNERTTESSKDVIEDSVKSERNTDDPGESLESQTITSERNGDDSFVCHRREHFNLAGGCEPFFARNPFFGDGELHRIRCRKIRTVINNEQTKEEE